ncbi:bifunctional (p)ppGpp synthetase/guanosine-3',5'-bis(diphosphate) 3'-pyrophosphohydrolase [Listeria weihenstephanensis]|uniref:Bifunctional (P)ppGpp synthetase/guanosine-3',5'-bis(Diphosphate) 3'-pyrophosphohydrolase n=1 Tax=Listeria weihenstephanensis TaxID=1006155 RepID=A0A841Z9U1_9LIST|nr:HD domain-containing protein [Listeria weihenstephanensis]MBC1502085.1 bifunctional (p)ppGpp synthetase/guanosine-3',5'-bis(diphosphate) 3'-pyrophosphohydrolase [Listeria weihenstephanensis]
MYQQASAFAAKAHQMQRRKITGEPYFSHPRNVANLLRKAGFREEVVAAGFLHDVVEDTPVTLDEIRALFGNDVAELVESHTEDKSQTWEERKSHTIDAVRTGTLEEKAIIVADKLDNLQSIKYALSSEGNKVWSYFKRGYELQKWYNEGIVSNMYEGLRDEEIPAYFKEYERLCRWIFRK